MDEGGGILCYYGDYLGYGVAMVHAIPLVIAWSISVVGLVTHEVIFFLFGLFLHFMQICVIFLQSYYHRDTVDLYCKFTKYYTFPNTEMFFIIAVITFVLLYHYLWKSRLTIITYIFLLIFLLIPIIILFIVGTLDVLNIFLTIIISSFSTTIFVILLHFYIIPNLKYTLKNRPWSWFGYKNTYI